MVYAEADTFLWIAQQYISTQKNQNKIRPDSFSCVIIPFQEKQFHLQYKIFTYCYKYWNFSIS